jgi:3-dehydroquinate synthetase
MLAEAHLSWKSGRLNEPEFRRMERLLCKVPLNAAFAGIDRKTIEQCILNDKKASDGRVKMVLPRSIGECEVTHDFDLGLINPAIDFALRNLSGSSEGK